MTTQVSFQIAPASRMANVSYAIRDLAVVADQVAKQGHKILYLNIGDPCTYDFQTPPHMIEAATKAMRDGFNGYGDSLGEHSAVEAIRARAERRGFQGIRGVMVGFGSGEVIDHCLTALINPGDNVLTPCPDYPLYGAVLGKISAEPNPYFLTEENGWQPDLDDIAARINSRTKAILLINPNNPTGAIYSKETLEGIAELARRNNLLILADEIYDSLVLDEEQKHISIAALAPDVPVITFNGLSKAYLVPGWRIGWAVATGPEGALDDYLEAVYKLLRARLSAPHPFMYAIAPALNGPQDHLIEVRNKLRRRRDITAEWAARTPRVSLTAPHGAFYAFPKLDIPEDDKVFVTELVQQKYVLCVHGSGFGQRPGTHHMRIVYLPPEDVLRQAYDRISEFMAERYRD
ncbi:MAG: aminotransferase class I/II-fold pyridoxal phosphate-dependent enzyme [Acidobacteriota bacterium]|nr:aminotransferase class I/II-fold pyridoxal phosphate-dependent enzyme [Acidobacteriota bacterium]